MQRRVTHVVRPARILLKLLLGFNHLWPFCGCSPGTPRFDDKLDIAPGLGLVALGEVADRGEAIPEICRNVEEPLVMRSICLISVGLISFSH